MDQDRIGRNHSYQEAIKLGSRWCHPQCSIEPGDVRNSYDKTTDRGGQDHNGDRGSRLDEGDFSSPKEMDNEELKCKRH